MDQFSHDLAVALEETSLMDRAYGIAKWGSRRRTRSTGNLPSAPQPTEDSLSSPNEDRKKLQTQKQKTPAAACQSRAMLPMAVTPLNINSDSDDERRCIILPNRLRGPTPANRTGGALESDSLNENNFSPARFLKMNSRRRRRREQKRSTEDLTQMPLSISETNMLNANTLGKRSINQAGSRLNSSFCGKRKRSNRDRYHDQNNYTVTKVQSLSNVRHASGDCSYMRPRSYSSTSKPSSARLLPLNKGLLSKIERVAESKHSECVEGIGSHARRVNVVRKPASSTITPSKAQASQLRDASAHCHAHRRKVRVSKVQTDPSTSMDCTELYEFLSSSSISSSGSEDEYSRDDCDHEGDDELTDWPGNEFAGHFKYYPNRKLIRKSTLPQIRSDDAHGEDDATMMVTSMSVERSAVALNAAASAAIKVSFGTALPNSDHPALESRERNEMHEFLRPKQIESEMSGEISNPLFPMTATELQDIREIRAGCRRIKGERPGFSIKLGINELLARFLQDTRQVEIRLPDIEAEERKSLTNLATLYSLNIRLEKGCAILNKTSNTTQLVNIDDQRRLKNTLTLSDFKRLCVDGNKS